MQRFVPNRPSSSDTLLIAKLGFVALGFCPYQSLQTRKERLGLGGACLLRSVQGILLAYGLLLVVHLVFNTLGDQLEVFRQENTA
jgi:hypothetical protein